MQSAARASISASAAAALREIFLRILFLLFLVVPIIEMYVLIEVGGLIGPWPTIGLVALTAMIGVALLRQQGFSTLMRGRARLNAGELPAREMLEGLLLAVGGALLLTPGFITDSLGFLLLLPPTRWFVVRALLRRGVVSVTGAGFRAGDGTRGFGPSDLDGRGGQGRPGSADGGRGGRPEVRRTRDGRHVIDGEWERRDD